MKEIQSILNAYSQIDFTRMAAALATVVRVEGSSYRRTGARMLVLDNGTYLGGISGGCLEGDALRRAQKAIASDKASVVTYDTTKDDDHQVGVGLGCNGIIDVMFTTLKVSDENNPVNILSALPATRIPRVVVSITGSNDDVLGKAVLYENDAEFLSAFPLKEISTDVLLDVKKSLGARISQSLSYHQDTERIFIEVILPVTHLVMYGGNYDIYPMVRLARELGWKVTVVTNISKAEKSLFDIASEVIHNKGEKQPVVDDFTSIVLMSHDYKTDLRNFRMALGSDASYIGMLGPKKRAQKMFSELLAEGKPVSEENLLRIFAPAGLDIGANIPEEIALSILAEIVSIFTGRTGASLRLRESTIHENERNLLKTE
jgi:xanthine dehydrogenase accessory factor